MQSCILQKTNAWLLAKGENGREEIRFGINIPTLLYIKCIKEIANKGLLFSTGKYAEYFITHKGKEPEKQYVFLVYKRSIQIERWLNHCTIHMKLTQHGKSTICQFKNVLLLFRPLYSPQKNQLLSSDLTSQDSFYL